MAQTLIGFANADGGSIVIGLSDGKIEGTDEQSHRVNELRQAHMELCQPAVPVRTTLIECTTSKGAPDHLLLIEVRAGETVYATKGDDVFLRVGDETRRLTFQQRQELLYDRGQGSYESRLVGSARFDELDEALLDEYMQSVAATDRQRLMRARGLANDGSFTVAGTLLFSAHPQRHLPEAYVRVLRYPGVRRGSGSRQQLEYDERIEGPIARQLVRARAAITEQQPQRRALGGEGRFEPVPLVPEDAWLEGLVNAVVHRSYSLAGDHIRVEIFSDRIEIESPGRFPSVFPSDDPLGAPRYARNPQIARVCADQQFGQELGEGIRRMFDEMRLAGLADPLYTPTSASVRLTLLAEPANRELDARLPRDSRTIVALLRDAGGLSTSEVAEAVGMSRITARKRLEVLREEGLVAWDGKSPRDPRASWRLPDR